MIITYFIILIVFLIIWKIIYNKFLNITYFKSDYDNQYYIIRNNGTLEDKKKTAQLLATIRVKLINFCNFLFNKYKSDKNLDKIKRFFNRLYPDNIIEAPLDEYNTSYCINKGQEIAICLREKKNHSKFFEENTIIYVLLHELAHVMCISIGHGEEFTTNFIFLLNNAIEFKLWKPINYEKCPKPYCGITIMENLLDLENSKCY